MRFAMSSILFYAALAIIAVSGCTLTAAIPPTPAPTPTVSIKATDPIMATDGWKPLTTGLEQRTYTPNGNTIAQFVVLRIDPAHYTFRVHYRPGQSLTVQEWADTLPDATAFVNANFFTENQQTLGLLVADGTVYSAAFRDLGGIFHVQGGQARVRSTSLEPYRGETLEQAVQAYPMLVVNGKQAYTNMQPDRFSRRTVIGQDTTGRIIIMATPFLGLTLLDLSAYLPTTDLNLVNAFNLDGGRSTLMYIRSPEYILNSVDAVPAVLAIYPR